MHWKRLKRSQSYFTASLNIHFESDTEDNVRGAPVVSEKVRTEFLAIINQT